MAIAFDDFAIDRNTIPRSHDDQIIHSDIANRDLRVNTVAANDGIDCTQ